jgi:quercetin dioxygenase-like cupin family protein
MARAIRSQRRTLTKRVAQRVAAASLGVCLALQPVLATPPTEGVHFVYYTLTIDPDSTDRVQIRLPTAFEYEEDTQISRATRSPSVFIFMDATYDPNATSGWHYHPGIVLNTVVDGQVDWYDGNCVRHVLKKGDHFVEGNRVVHKVYNHTTAPARMIQAFIITKGVTFKIDTPAPSCAAALGLN